MPKIFISYRREDTAGWTRHLASDLEARFGRGSVFLDIDRIVPGDDFVSAIERTMTECSATLVVIGPGWLRAADASGRRRLDSPEDFVRQEIAMALRGPAPVIPVLVGQAPMPAAADLPQELQALSRRQAVELSDTRRAFDVARLFAALETHLPGARLQRLAMRGVVVGAAAAAVLAAFWFWPRAPENGRLQEPRSESRPQAVADATRRVAIGAGEITDAPSFYPGSFAFQYAGSGIYLTPADSEAPMSRLFLLENGRLLGPAHQPRRDVYARGGGRYSHFKTANGDTDLIFSTSDNSDPRTNSRTYLVTDEFTIPVNEIRPGDGLMFQYFGDGAQLTPADTLAPRDRESKLRLYEDGKELPQPHAGHEDISTRGRGRYSHWTNGGDAYLNFSTANPKEDPRTNSRTYTIRLAE